MYNVYDLQLVENRIMSIAAKKGLSKNKLLINAELSKSIFDNMKKGRIPSVDKIHAIADYLGCSVDYLLGRTDESTLEQKTPTLDMEDGLNDQEKRFMKYAQELTPDQKDLLMAQMQLMLQQKQEQPVSVPQSSGEI